MFREALRVETILEFDIRARCETVRAKLMTEAEFENFYNAHSRPLWNYARRVANSPEVADDVVQESFLRMLSANIGAEQNRRAYLYRIATNLVYDNFRRGKRELPETANFESASAYEPFAPESDIGKVFDKLKPQERALLWLSYVEGHEHREIAAMLGLQPLSIRVLLFRARRRLAALIAD